MHYSDGSLLVKRAIIIVAAGSTEALRHTDRNNKKTIFKKCAPFIQKIWTLLCQHII